jgi:hypothetical protein
MGEDIPDNPRLFEIPADGQATLPDFRPVSAESIPPIVSDLVLRLDRTGTITRRAPLETAQRLDFGPAGETYVLPYYEERSSLEDKQNAVYVIDVSESGEVMGFSISTLNLPADAEGSNTPFVRDTFTNYDYLRKGLNLRRLIVLNEANKLFFQKILHSNPSIGPGAELVWQRLEQAGLAKRDQGGYSFIK